MPRHPPLLRGDTAAERDYLAKALRQWRNQAMTPAEHQRARLALVEWLPPRTVAGEGETFTGRLYAPDWYPDSPAVYPEDEETV